ncbi:hypothetical protein [Bacillus sp. IBL03825]|uniref:hypothetical protein n=1 Tax=Bacillus sp. IBL03825 TaxID=2953580 RepID=UPI00215781FF|nr:hypothetical protein [Bacillus sp. IBL03825]MCR6850501.1 hypothetical protein [Bacillus sp. IBL03825]
MSSGFFITSGKTKAAVGGWYKVTAGGTDCQARVYTDRTVYEKNPKNSGYFSSSTPLKSLKIGQTYLGDQSEVTFVHVQLYKNATHTERAGELFSTNITIHPR